MENESLDRNYNKQKTAFGSGASKIHAANFNAKEYANDNSKAAIHAREWGKRKPYYLIAKEREEAMKKKKSQENN